MKTTQTTRLHRRVLKLNVGFLLADGPGHNHNSMLDVPAPIQVADDLTLNYIKGPLRLSRTKEGILVQSKRLVVSVDTTCSRCLDEFTQEYELDLEELYALNHPNSADFVIHEDGILDLGPLIREEVLILMSQRSLCQPDCQGICPQCGTNLNHGTCDCDRQPLDPRFAKLRILLESDD